MTTPPRKSLEPRASIVICTRNRADDLAQCLASVMADRSTVPRELVVIDNGSTDRTQAVLEEAAASAPFPLRTVIEATPGLSRARNAGLRSARAEVVLFTDDDVVVEDGWADALVRPFADGDVAGAAGRIKPIWPHDPPPWLQGPQSHHLALIDYGPDDAELGPDRLPLGANMALRRSTLVALGLHFDEALGHSDGVSYSFEEWHLFRELMRHGRVTYAADAVAHHRIRAEKMTWQNVRRSLFQAGFGLARSERLLNESPPPRLARRAVRAIRTYRGARRLRRRNQEHERCSGAEAWEEFYAYTWAGKHIELLVGRFPRLAAVAAKRLA